MHLVSAFIKAVCCLYSILYTGYPSKCRLCIGNYCLGAILLTIVMYSVWCRPGVNWWSIHMVLPVVWIRQLSGACLDLFQSELDPLSLL